MIVSYSDLKKSTKAERKPFVRDAVLRIVSAYSLSSLEELADFLELNDRTVKQWISEGHLPKGAIMQCHLDTGR